MLDLAGSALRAAARYVASSLASNIPRLIAVGWLSGLAAFGYVTVQRARALAASETATPPKAKSMTNEPVEVVEMLDVDQMNQIRTDRMHAQVEGTA